MAHNVLVQSPDRVPDQTVTSIEVLLSPFWSLVSWEMRGHNCKAVQVRCITNEGRLSVSHDKPLPPSQWRLINHLPSAPTYKPSWSIAMWFWQWPCDYRVFSWTILCWLLSRFAVVTRQAKYVKRNTEACSWNHCSSRKASMAYSECMSVALGIQYAMRMSSVASPAPLNIYPHYLINGTFFEKNFIEHKMCVLIFSTTFAWNISHSKNKWARYDENGILVSM
jgi:hypothetical protein